MTLSHILHEEYAFLGLIVFMGLLEAFIWWKAPEGWERMHKKKSWKVTSVLTILCLAFFGYRGLSLNHISQDEFESWVSEYDPFFKPEDGQPDWLIHQRYQEFGRAVSAHRRGGGTAPITAALAGAQGAEAPHSGALATIASLGLFTSSSDEMLADLEQLRAGHQYMIKTYGTVGVPQGSFLDETKFKVLPIAQTDLLTQQDREHLTELLVANILWEAKREAPEEWLEGITGHSSELGIDNIRICVELLIALGADEALQEVEDLVLPAIQGVYRKRDASFLLWGPVDQRDRRIKATLTTADDALFLMEHYGVPDFVDLPGFHKYLDKERTGFSPQHPEQYLAAALMFRLEQLHPEL